MASPKKRTLTDNDIHKLPDLRAAIYLLRELKIGTQGITNLEEAKTSLRDYVRNSNKSERVLLQLDVVKDDMSKRDTLLKMYRRTCDYLQKLPVNMKADLHELFPNFLGKLNFHISELEKRDCLIILAGETGSGKSSLINMILGEKVLPISSLCCTATFCEVRGSQNGAKYAVAHFKDKRLPAERIDLTTAEGMSRFANYVKLPDDPEADCTTSFVQVYWPSNILKDGIVLIDTPGIGENKEMISYLASYMSQAFGFLYVINATSAGGVQKDRLSRLLQIINESNTEDTYLSEATIFISNKWETIPEHERSEVREDTLRKLRRFYPHLRDEQLICLSINKLSLHMRDRIASEEIQEFFTGIRELIPATMKNKTYLSYMWLSSLLKRSVYSLKVKQNIGSNENDDKAELFSTIRKQIAVLERNSFQCIEEMKTEVHNELYYMKEGLIAYLTRDKVKRILDDWNTFSAPSPNGRHWREVGQKAIDIVGSKMVVLIDQWEQEHNIVSGLKMRMIGKFKQKFDQMEREMFGIECMLTGDKGNVVNHLQQSFKKPSKARGLINIFSRENDDESFSSTHAISFAISSLGHVDLEKKEVKKKLKIYMSSSKPKANELMSDISKQYVKSIIESPNLIEILSKFFQGLLRSIDALGSMLPEFLKADRVLLNNLEREFVKSEYNLSEKLPDFLRECHRLQGKLDMFYVQELLVPDIDLKSIVLDPLNPPLGTGSYSTVFLCHLKLAHGERKVAAMKAWSEKLSINNVSDTLLEDSILKDMNHINVVRYYGSTFRRLHDGSLQWLMIMEYCHSTLKNVFVDNDNSEVNPAKYENNQSKQVAAMKRMSSYALQVVEGMAYLHRKDLVHRDLKMENVLIAEGDIVKMTDVGLSKPEMEITGSVAGSPCYMAPEIFERKIIYGKEADIYSLAIMIWEMWYGLDVAAHIRPLIQRGIENSIINGLRPSLTLAGKPPENLKKLLFSCWHGDPAERMKIDEIVVFFKRWPSK